MKTLSANLQTLFYSTAHAQIVAFVELAFDSGTHRYTTAAHDISWNGYSWVGVGNIASIEPVKDTEALEATGLKLALSGIPTSLVSLALSEHVQGKTAKMWVAGIDSTGAVVADPVLEFQGRVDTLFISDTAESATIGINVESRLADFQRPNARRFTDADQQKAYPGDRFFSHVAAMNEKELIWPARSFFG